MKELSSEMNGGVTSPKGFLACGISAGIKRSGRDDLGLIFSQVPAVAAAAFTSNQFIAAPVVVSKKALRNAYHQAVIVNSGNANCANGRPGVRDAAMMASLAGRGLGVPSGNVLVASTGIIGERLPLERIKSSLPRLIDSLSSSGGSAFARSIMTTDTVKKECAVRIRIGGTTVTIGGAVKGVGMLHPELVTAPHATMLCFLTTDAAIGRSALRAALADAVDRSFNLVSVDGDMSTNDSVFLFANGLADNRAIAKASGDGYRRFVEGLRKVTRFLAESLVSDGEGATKVLEVVVRGARNDRDARIIARKVTTSSLLKSAVYGCDPNWGRVVAAAGSSGVSFNPDRLDVSLAGVKVMRMGRRVPGVEKARLRHLYAPKKIVITVDLNAGSGTATAWTCDLSEEYVRINSAYST